MPVSNMELLMAPEKVKGQRLNGKGSNGEYRRSQETTTEPKILSEMGIIKDMELEWDAARARVRAERKCGELLSDMERGKANQHTAATPDGAEEQKSEYADALDRSGISTQQSSNYQKLAAVPEQENHLRPLSKVIMNISKQRIQLEFLTKPLPLMRRGARSARAR